MTTANKKQIKQQPVQTYPQEGLARVPEAARFLAVSRASIYKMIEAGELKFMKVRSAIRIPWKALHEFAAKA